MLDLTHQDTTRRIVKVGRYHLALFLLPVLSVLYYGWLKAPFLNERPDNPQRVAPLYLRGRILDHAGRPLADTIDRERTYPARDAAGSLVGYQLRGRNHTGLEAALQVELSPPLPPSGLLAALRQDEEVNSGRRLRLRGPDVSLTLDLELQKALYQAIAPVSGAVVVSDGEGRILAAVSYPSFDPNRVREQWQELREDERSPFVERVGSGLYPVTAAEGLALLQPSDTAEHRWFSQESFPAYPLASSATYIEGRLFLTPLMMLEACYWADGSQVAPALRLFPDSGLAEGAKVLPLAWPEASVEDGVKSWEFGAPPFGESPQFQAMVGTVAQTLWFSLVLESDDEQARQAKMRVVKALRQSDRQVPSGGGL